MEYRVVVLPLPVGPVTRIRPSGRSIIRPSSASAPDDIPQLVERNEPPAAVEHPQHDVLPVRGGKGRDPVVDVTAGHGEGHPAVLGGARLRDVHAAHHLEAHGDRGPVAAVEAPHLTQHAVDAVAHPQEPAFRLEVDVGGRPASRRRTAARPRAGRWAGRIPRPCRPPPQPPRPARPPPPPDSISARNPGHGEVRVRRRAR